MSCLLEQQRKPPHLANRCWTPRWELREQPASQQLSQLLLLAERLKPWRYRRPSAHVVKVRRVLCLQKCLYKDNTKALGFSLACCDRFHNASTLVVGSCPRA